MSKRKRSPEAKWCDGVVSLASELHGTPTQIATALLDTVFILLAEQRGLRDSGVPFADRFKALAFCGGDPTMLPKLTPSFAEISVKSKDERFQPVMHIDVLGELHCRLMSPEDRHGQGSHYTPREMAAEIVMHTLDPLVLPADECEPPHYHGGRPDKPTAAEIANLKVCDPAMGGGVFLVEVIRYLGDALHKAMAREGKNLSLHDCRVAVATRCVYGIDRDPTAVWLAKRVVWLFLEEPTLSLHAFDHALRHGDALVGLDREQLLSFHWENGHAPMEEIAGRVDRLAVAAKTLRALFTTHRLPDDVAANIMDNLDGVLSDARLIGDLCIGAFFANKKTKAREQERLRRAGLVLAWLRSGAVPPGELLTLQSEFRDRHPAFHWHIEIPEAFWPQAQAPTVVSADARAVKAIESAHGQMGWAL